MEYQDIDRYRKGVRIADDIEKIRTLIEKLTDGAGIWVGVNCKMYDMPESSKDLIREVIITGLSRQLKQLTEEFRRL